MNPVPTIPQSHNPTIPSSSSPQPTPIFLTPQITSVPILHPSFPTFPRHLKPKPIKHLHIHRPPIPLMIPTPRHLPHETPEDQFAGQLAVAGWNQSVMLVMHKSTTNDHSSKKVPKLFNTITRSRRIMDDTTTQWPNSAGGGAEGLPKFFVAWGTVNRRRRPPKLPAMPSSIILLLYT
jgi:hypothetical protein